MPGPRPRRSRQFSFRVMFARVAAGAARGAGAARRAARPAAVRVWASPVARPCAPWTASSDFPAVICGRGVAVSGREREIAPDGAGRGAFGGAVGLASVEAAGGCGAWGRVGASPLGIERAGLPTRAFGTGPRGDGGKAGEEGAGGAGSGAGPGENPSEGAGGARLGSAPGPSEAAPLPGASSSASASVPDPLVTSTWVDRAPSWAQPFLHLARADKPIGTYLLLWPCAWSIALAAPAGSLPDARLLLLFGAGAFLLRGAGCTINDLWDRDFDRRVERTQSRPLAAGTATVPGAAAFLVAQLLAGLQILLQLNPAAQVVGAASLPLVAAYPLAKRVIGAPQLVLGMAFNWGAHLGWIAARGDGWMAHEKVAVEAIGDGTGAAGGAVGGAAEAFGAEEGSVGGAVEAPGAAEGPVDASLSAASDAVSSSSSAALSLDSSPLEEPSNLLSALLDPASLSALSAHLPELLPVALPLYLGCISWTLVYDTVYAHQDKDDDVKIGVKSTALTWGAYNRPIMAAFAGLFGAGLAAAGAGAECWGPFYASAALATGLVAKQALLTDLSDRPACGAAFVSNHKIGQLVFAGIVLDKATALL